MAMSVDEIGLVLNYARQRMTTKGERWGQALYNALDEVRPELADEVCGTGADPFYDEGNVDAFYTFLARS